MGVTKADLRFKVKKLNAHYRKTSVRKRFGRHGWFFGIVTDVWVQPSGKAWAHVRYTDGDEEDIPLSNIPQYLVKPLEPLSEAELQRPRSGGDKEEGRKPTRSKEEEWGGEEEEEEEGPQPTAKKRARAEEGEGEEEGAAAVSEGKGGGERRKSWLGGLFQSSISMLGLNGATGDASAAAPAPAATSAPSSQGKRRRVAEEKEDDDDDDEKASPAVSAAGGEDEQGPPPPTTKAQTSSSSSSASASVVPSKKIFSASSPLRHAGPSAPSAPSSSLSLLCSTAASQGSAAGKPQRPQLEKKQEEAAQRRAGQAVGRSKGSKTELAPYKGLVGRRIKKKFPQGTYSGIITEVWAGGPPHRRQVYAHVKYVDGDKEDIECYKVNALLVPLKSKSNG